MANETDKQLKDRLIREERLRREVAQELGKPSTPPWLSENAKWIIAALLIPFVTWIYGLSQERIAERNRAQEAVVSDARNDVSALTSLLPALTDPDPARSSVALAILTRLKTAQRDPQSPSQQVFAAIEAQIQARATSGNAAERTQASVSAEAISRASGEQAVTETRVEVTPVRTTPPNVIVAEVRPRRAFLQIWSESQRAAAESLQTSLREAGVPVPGIDNVSRLAARAGPQPVGQVRYFHSGDQAAAQWTANRIRAQGGQAWTVVRARTVAGVPAGQIELWWPRSTEPRPAGRRDVLGSPSLDQAAVEIPVR